MSIMPTLRVSTMLAGILNRKLWCLPIGRSSKSSISDQHDYLSVVAVSLVVSLTVERRSLSFELTLAGNRYRHRLSLLKGGKAHEQKGLDLDRRVLRLVRAACWAVQVSISPWTTRKRNIFGLA